MIQSVRTSHPISDYGKDSPEVEEGETHSDRGKEYARSREVILVIKTLPNRVPPTNTVCVDSDLG